MQRRLEWLDICKGIAIISVVFGHTLVQELRSQSIEATFLYNCLYFYHNRLFFVLSGFSFSYFFKQEKCSRFIKNKFKRLMIPYYVYASVIYVVFLIIQLGAKKFSSISFFLPLSKEDFLIGLMVGNNVLASHLWYLYVLFILIIISFIIKKNNIRFEIILVCSIIFYLLSYYNSISVIYILKLVLNYSVYFFAGCIMGKRKKESKNLLDNKYYFLIYIYFGLSWLYMILRAYFVSNSLQSWLLVNNGFFTLICSFGVIFSIIIFSKKIEGNKLLANIGKNTLSIYLLHQPLIVSGGCTLVLKLIPNYVILGCVVFGCLGILVPYCLVAIWRILSPLGDR